tara:strand:+ start:70 stop:387 length:318 start_codon:yes stop_codon:yes gene_type:complete
MPSRRAPHTDPLTAPPDLPVLTRLLAPLLPRNTIQSKTERRRFNLHELCDAVREQYAPRTAAKQLSFDFVVSEKLPAWVVGDRHRLNQVLLPLPLCAFVPVGASL